MNVLSLTNNYRLEPKRTNLFTLVLNSVPGINGTDVIEKLQIDLKSASRPTYTHNTLVLERFNMKYKVAQAPSMDHNLTVTFRDTVQLNLGRIFYYWNKVIFNRKTGAMGYAAAYKTDGSLYVFDPLGEPIEKWDFKGLFPSSTNWSDMSYGAGDEMTVEVTFAYDIAFLDESVDSTDFPQNRVGATTLGAQTKTEEVEIPPS